MQINRKTGTIKVSRMAHIQLAWGYKKAMNDGLPQKITLYVLINNFVLHCKRVKQQLRQVHANIYQLVDSQLSMAPHLEKCRPAFLEVFLTIFFTAVAIFLRQVSFKFGSINQKGPNFVHSTVTARV